MDESLRMRCDEDCRTAGFGKTERPVGWEGNGEPIMMKLVRHCEGKPAATDRLHLQSLSHSFTLDLEPDRLPRAICVAQVDASADRVFAWKVAVGERLIDDHH
jgi:hypothetical protein